MDSIEFSELSSLIKDLHTQVIELRGLVSNKLEESSVTDCRSFDYRSKDIAELSTALAKAQGSFEVAPLNKRNPYFKSSYADYMSVVMASRPALEKNGLAVTQDLIFDSDGSLILMTILMHSSGQYLKSRIRIVPGKSDIQSLFSHCTYLKRLTYASLVGVVTGDDDDGEASVHEQRSASMKTSGNTDYDPRVK